MIVTTVEEVIDVVFDETIQEWILYEGDVDDLFVRLDDLLINYELGGAYSNYNLYALTKGNKKGVLGVLEQ